MKNQDVMFYEIALEGLSLKGLDLVTLISRNQEMAAEEAKHLRAGIEPSEKIKEYRNKLNEIQQKFAKKNSEGNTIMRLVSVGGDQIEIPDIEDFDNPEGEYAREYAKLRAKYSDELTEYEGLINEFKRRLGDENENFKPRMIDFQYLPKDIGSKEMKIIWGLIDKNTLPEHLR